MICLKIAFVFPGQGAQYTGMAKDFYEKICCKVAKYLKAHQKHPDLM